MITLASAVIINLVNKYDYIINHYYNSKMYKLRIIIYLTGSSITM